MYKLSALLFGALLFVIGLTIQAPSANAATTGTLIIVKTVINNDSGTSVPSDFTIQLDYFNVEATSTSNITGDSQGTSIEIPADTYYEVYEAPNKSYSTSYSPNCVGYLSAGETKSCTVTNDDVNVTSGTLIVKKIVDNSYGNNKVASDFTINVTYTNIPDGDSSPSSNSISFPGDSTGTVLTVGAGDYSVSEDSVPHYTATYSDECTGAMTAGTTTTCTIINQDSTWGMGSNDPYINPTPNTGSQPTEEPTPEEPTPEEPTSNGTNEPDNENPDTTDTTTTTQPTPRVLGAEDEIPTQYSCTITEPEALYITSDVNDILGHLSVNRDTDMENKYNNELTPRVTPADLDSAILSAVQNFINYGTRSTVKQGQGERAGLVNSFKANYGRVPQDACDWQNVIKMANTKLPDSLNTEREDLMRGEFSKMYNRQDNRDNPRDYIAIKIMSYGIRPQIRNLDAERQAISVFESIFGHKPTGANEWDMNRALAYSGVYHPFLPSYLETAISRISQLR